MNPLISFVKGTPTGKELRLIVKAISGLDIPPGKEGDQSVLEDCKDLLSAI
jgi:hypothetical protein